MITLPTTCHLFDSFFIKNGTGEACISAIIKFENNFDYEKDTISTDQVDMGYAINRETDFKFRFFTERKTIKLPT